MHLSIAASLYVGALAVEDENFTYILEAWYLSAIRTGVPKQALGMTFSGLVVECECCKLPYTAHTLTHTLTHSLTHPPTHTYIHTHTHTHTHTHSEFILIVQ